MNKREGTVKQVIYVCRYLLVLSLGLYLAFSLFRTLWPETMANSPDPFYILLFAFVDGVLLTVLSLTRRYSRS